MGCLIREEVKKEMIDYKLISERIMTITLRKKEVYTFIVVYGPNEDDKEDNKTSFWEKLQMTFEKARGIIIVLGDLNCRVGNDTKKNFGIIGRYGEEKINNNGKRLVDFCRANQLIVSNTFFQHKDAHKYTREVTSRDEKSIIDYIIIAEKDKKLIQDVRVYRSPEIGSDHFLLTGKLKVSNDKNDQKPVKIPVKKVIKTY